MSFYESSYIQRKGQNRIKGGEVNYDQYFIKLPVMKTLIDRTKEVLKGEKFDLIIDPCCGPAHYKNLIREQFPGTKLVMSDIDPKHQWIEKRDFIAKPHFRKRPKKDVLVFCNPPFEGLRKSDTFMKNVFRFAKAAAFVLPDSYRNRDRGFVLADDPRWRVISEDELPANIFTVNNQEFSWKCILQIWIRIDVNADTPTIRPDVDPIGFELITDKKRMHADLWLIWMGKDAGLIQESGSRGRSRNVKWGINSPILKGNHENKDRVRLMVNNCARIRKYGSRGTADKKDTIQKLNAIFSYMIDN